MKTIDACGLSCPQPVVLTGKAIAASPEGVEVKVDNRVALENVTRYAANAGYKVSVSEDEGIFTLAISK